MDAYHWYYAYCAGCAWFEWADSFDAALAKLVLHEKVKHAGKQVGVCGKSSIYPHWLDNLITLNTNMSGQSDGKEC